MIRSWAAGADTDAAEAPWQPELWRRLRNEDQRPEPGRTPSRGVQRNPHSPRPARPPASPVAIRPDPHPAQLPRRARGDRALPRRPSIRSASLAGALDEGRRSPRHGSSHHEARGRSNCGHARPTASSRPGAATRESFSWSSASTGETTDDHHSDAHDDRHASASHPGGHPRRHPAAGGTVAATAGQETHATAPTTTACRSTRATAEPVRSRSCATPFCTSWRTTRRSSRGTSSSCALTSRRSRR